MLKRLKLKSLFIVVALLALAGLLSSTTVQEAAWAEGAQVEVTLEITNTAAPIGGTTYEISMIIFTKNFVPIATQIIMPSASIEPGQTRIFGPYTPSEEPNDLTIKGRKTFAYPPFEEPFSFTIFPLNSDVPYQVDSLMVVAHIVAVAPSPLPPESVVRSIEEHLIKPLVEVREKMARSKAALEETGYLEASRSLDDGFYLLGVAIDSFRTYEREGIHIGVSKVMAVARDLPVIEFPGRGTISTSLVKLVADGAATAGCYAGCRGASNYWGCVDGCLGDEICVMH